MVAGSGRLPEQIQRQAQEQKRQHALQRNGFYLLTRQSRIRLKSAETRKA